jgi:hypothetical protein
MTTNKTYTAIWTPGWYELDQSLVLGELQKYWFFNFPPQCEASLGESNQFPCDLLFFNQLDSSENCCVRYARIQQMVHPQLGPLMKIDTDGLDYIFYPVEGEEVVVNAEENPGEIVNPQWEMTIEDWSVLVTLSEVSEPVGEIV